MAKVELKQPIVAEISELLNGAASAVVVDYRGLTVAQDTELRKQLREAGVAYKVYKNTMIKRAAEGTDFAALDPDLEGPTAIAVSKDDATAPARILVEFAKKADKLEIKAGVVERDPKEQGERALLNLGHTVGHAVEKLKNFTLLHGQCVGAGLVAAAYLSMKRGLLTEEEYQEIRQGCADYDLPVHVDGLIPEEVLLATKKDKKMEQGHIKFILMDGIGKSFIDKTVTDEELLSCIQEITL